MVIIMPALRIIIFSRCKHEKFVIVLSIIKTISLGKTDRVDDGAALSTDDGLLDGTALQLCDDSELGVIDGDTLGADDGTYDGYVLQL